VNLNGSDLPFSVFRWATGLRFALILRCSPELLFADIFLVLDDCFLSFFNPFLQLLDLVLACSRLYRISQLSSFLLLLFAAINQPLLVGLGSAFCGAVPFSLTSAPKDEVASAPAANNVTMIKRNLFARLAIIFYLRLMGSFRRLPLKCSTE